MTVRTEAELEDALARPRPILIKAIRSVQTPLLILGAGGKMGPTLAVLARRAADEAGHPLRIIAVSRFSDGRAREWLRGHGVEVCEADLLERESFARLPEAENIIYLVGLKFGTAQNPALTWAINTLPPAYTVERYLKARIVALSTGNVYPMVPVKSGGATEDQPLTPLGEYANAAVARERVFEYCSRKHDTAVALIRLNYAVELRYGVLVDIARHVWTEAPIDLRNGYFNCIWQGDANEMILRALPLASTHASAWNLTLPGIASVRETASAFGRLLGKAPRFVNTESDTALLSNAGRICAQLDRPATTLEAMIEAIAPWVRNGGRYLDKPTHFEVRDGTY